LKQVTRRRMSGSGHFPPPRYVVVDDRCSPVTGRRGGYQVLSREQQTSEALRSLVKSDIEKWRLIIKEFGIKAE
jgi:hypothetical protein